MNKFFIGIIFFILIHQCHANEVLDDFDLEYKSQNQDDFDPLKYYNIFMTNVNDKLFIYILEPTSKSYALIIPKQIRQGINNFLLNLEFPVRFANNLLQLKIKNSIEEFYRFTINSTLGIFGILDPASYFYNIKKHDADFGQTLGAYGVKEGFHIVLPFLGPSNLRDTFGILIDNIASPTNITAGNLIKYKITKNIYQEIGILTLYHLNKYSFNPYQYNTIKKDSLDLYPFFKSLYNQKRTQEIKRINNEKIIFY